MRLIKVFFKDLIENRLPKPFSRQQSIIFLITCPLWIVLFTAIDLYKTDYHFSVYLFPFFYLGILLPACIFFGDQTGRPALPFTNKIPVLNAIIHSLFFSFTLYMITKGATDF